MPNSTAFVGVVTVANVIQPSRNRLRRGESTREPSTYATGGRCPDVEINPRTGRGTPPTPTRQVIKSDFATVTFVEVEFEIPPRQRGEVTTVEGLLRTSAERLGEAQDLRMERSPEVNMIRLIGLGPPG